MPENIIIIGDLFTFPDGNAATNRVYSYAKGFRSHGVSTHVICFRNDFVPVSEGVSEGTPYYHPFNQQSRSHYFAVRQWQKIRKYQNTFKILSRVKKTGKIIAIHCYSISLLTQVFSFFLARCFSARLLLEVSEHPMQYYDHSQVSRMIGKIRMYTEVRLFDGLLCISHYLSEFYQSKGARRSATLVVPSTVDATRFSQKTDPVFPFQYIAYCGRLSTEKDGVDVLINSFHKISAHYPDLHLVLIGSANTEQELNYFKGMTSHPEISEKVHFCGQVSRNLIPQYLTNARVLALSRPASLISDAGFPSKLSEYLATGIPVVVTSVGEIPLYLKHRVNAFLAEPGSADDFARKLEEVLNDYPVARKIGEAGIRLAQTEFNPEFQAKRVLDYIS